ncbi:septation protein A [Parvibaculum sp.]|uniref:septation protein A n=1 Tax=Parvibaculum sp. TaxID=2024848 RepID=UPI00391BFC8D
MSETQAEKTHGGMSASQWVRMAIELGPLAVFFILNSQADAFFGNEEAKNIFYATGGFMVATVISLSYSYAKFRKIPTMPLVSGVFVIVFGALTIYLQDEQFIKVKPTIVNALFAGALLGAAAFGRPIMKQLFDGAFDLTDKGWMVLTVRWGLFFIFLGVINEVVWRNFSTDFWVSFKLFGVMPLTMIFGLAQIPVLTKYAPPKRDEAAQAAD